MHSVPARMKSWSKRWWTTMPAYLNPFHLLSKWLTFLVLGPAFFNIADGCIRRSLFQSQSTTVQPTPTPPMDDSTGTTVAATHKQPCLEEEAQSMNCLHGGTCYAVVLNNNNRQSLCHCTEEWTGRRCEQVFIDPGILASMEQNMRTANIAAGVSVFILVVFVALLATYVHLRKKQRKKRQQPNSHDAEAINALEPNGRASEGWEVCASYSPQVHVPIERRVPYIDDGATIPNPSSPTEHTNKQNVESQPVIDADEAPPLPQKSRQTLL